ncbi:MAG: hypothetical protein ACYCUD_00520 [Candidatus Dormibacteria bacterium]
MTGRKVTWQRAAIVMAGLLGTALMALTAELSLGAFTATVANNVNQATSGTIVLHEGSSASTCFSTATNAISSNSNSCAINLLAGMNNAVPGGSPTSLTQTFKNVGAVNASNFTVAAGGCTASANSATGPYYGTDISGFCGKVDVTIENDTNSGSPVCVYPSGSGACPSLSATYTLASLATSTSTTPLTIGSLAAGGVDALKITVGLDSSATNPDQGLAASMPMTWELSQ